MMTPLLRKYTATMMLLLTIAVMASGCGSDSDSSSKESAAGQVDAAFVVQMVPHHESAIEMARIASEKADHAQIRALANSIIDSQTAEIYSLRQLQSELTGAGVTADTSAADLRGMSDEAMGMHMDASSLKTANPFDRAFIDMMIPHHQGAINMAKTQLAKGLNAEVKTLARAVIAAQAKEIAQMQQWRKSWYGSTLDVTTATGSSDSTSSDAMSEHNGH